MLIRTEANLYGASRIGVHELPMPATPPVPDTVEQRASGRYNYEITDHLGNVRATVGDVKTIASVAGGYSLSAMVRSASDAYPYGIGMDGRSFAAPSVYRFGFNTQEKSLEINSGGSHNTALFWEYDARTGRRWNLDPKPHFGVSDYSTFGLNPILNVDHRGDYFFGLFGSTSAERKETRAQKFADKVGGTVYKNDAGKSVVRYEQNGETVHKGKGFGDFSSWKNFGETMGGLDRALEGGNDGANQGDVNFPSLDKRGSRIDFSNRTGQLDPDVFKDRPKKGDPATETNDFELPKVWDKPGEFTKFGEKFGKGLELFERFYNGRFGGPDSVPFFDFRDNKWKYHQKNEMGGYSTEGGRPFNNSDSIINNEILK